MHTNWSDGSGEICAMADAAVARGYEFIAITDHSKGLSIANGINEAKLKKQSVEIEAVNRELRASVRIDRFAFHRNESQSLGRRRYGPRGFAFA